MNRLGIDLDTVLELLADRIAERITARMGDQAPASVEMVTPRDYAREHSMAVTTVRKLIRDGRLEAVRIGKRQWRVRRDAQIDRAAPAPAALPTETPAERARRILRGGR